MSKDGHDHPEPKKESKSYHLSWKVPAVVSVLLLIVVGRFFLYPYLAAKHEEEKAATPVASTSCPYAHSKTIVRFAPKRTHAVYVPPGMKVEFVPSSKTGLISVCAKNKLTLCEGPDSVNKLNASWQVATNTSENQTFPLAWIVTCIPQAPKNEVVDLKI